MRRIILVILIALPLAADTWYGPRTSTWLSDDHHWQLVVVPNVLSRATLYRKGWLGIRHRVSRAVDEGRVADALVTNDGTFVTLNLTTSGNDVIAIYRRDGTLVRKLALSDSCPSRTSHGCRTATRRSSGAGCFPPTRARSCCRSSRRSASR